MTEPATDHMRALLLSLREELQETDASGREASSVVELDQSRVGRLSRMDAMQAQAMSQASSRRRGESLRRIERALTRLDSGDFGVCIDCDEDINPKRLAFDPAAERCIRCAALAEGQR